MQGQRHSEPRSIGFLQRRASLIDGPVRVMLIVTTSVIHLLSSKAVIMKNGVSLLDQMIVKTPSAGLSPWRLCDPFQ